MDYKAKYENLLANMRRNVKRGYLVLDVNKETGERVVHIWSSAPWEQSLTNPDCEWSVIYQVNGETFQDCINELERTLVHAMVWGYAPFSQYALEYENIDNARKKYESQIALSHYVFTKNKEYNS